MIKQIIRYARLGMYFGYDSQRYFKPSQCLLFLHSLIYNERSVYIGPICKICIDMPLAIIASLYGAIIGFTLGVLMCLVKLGYQYIDASLTSDWLRVGQIEPLHTTLIETQANIQLMLPSSERLNQGSDTMNHTTPYIPHIGI
tara:strand:- start:115 stop:543 length:429 start_codon:yes stop_codon:yes gene_type:complete